MIRECTFESESETACMRDGYLIFLDLRVGVRRFQEKCFSRAVIRLMAPIIKLAQLQ